MKDPVLQESLFYKNELKGFKRFIRSEEDNKIMDEIRKQTRSGKPLGDGEFLKTLSERLGRRLSFRPKGRPRKK